MRRTPHSTIPIRRYRVLAALFCYFCLAASIAFGATTDISQRRTGVWAMGLVTGIAVLFVSRRLTPGASAATPNGEGTDFPRQLAELLSRVPKQAVPAPSSPRPNLCVRSIGGCPSLSPDIEDEIYGIGREALLNALRHSRAENIEVALTFCFDSLQMVVSDDGCGIAPDLVAAGRDSCRGLALMRDRAERIGGRLRLWSAPRRGTEVELSVPRIFSTDSRQTQLCVRQECLRPVGEVSQS